MGIIICVLQVKRMGRRLRTLGGCVMIVEIADGR